MPPKYESMIVCSCAGISCFAQGRPKRTLKKAYGEDYEYDLDINCSQSQDIPALSPSNCMQVRNSQQQPYATY